MKVGSVFEWPVAERTPLSFPDTFQYCPFDSCTAGTYVTGRAQSQNRPGNISVGRYFPLRFWQFACPFDPLPHCSSPLIVCCSFQVQMLARGMPGQSGFPGNFLPTSFFLQAPVLSVQRKLVSNTGEQPASFPHE